MDILSLLRNSSGAQAWLAQQAPSTGLSALGLSPREMLDREMSYDGSHPRQQEQAARDHFRSYGPQTLADAFIPGYGAGGDAKAASEAYGEGRYGAAALNAGMAALDFVPVLGALPAAAKGIRAASNAPSSRGYDDVADWLHSYLGSRTGKSEEDLRAQIRRVIQRANEPPHFGNFRPIDEAVADQVPIVTKGKSFVLSQRGRGPARPKINASPEPIGRSPGAMWGALDTQDYREDVRAGEVIENLYVDLETIPKERLAGGVTGYDWSDLQRAREIPPITLRQNKNGSLSIIDGNHRLRWARENGFDSVPAYVIRPQDGMNTGAQ